MFCVSAAAVLHFIRLVMNYLQGMKQNVSKHLYIAKRIILVAGCMMFFFSSI